MTPSKVLSRRGSSVPRWSQKYDYNTFYYNHQAYDENELEAEDINSLDDCIDGVEEPLYGFSVNVTLIQDDPCILGLTCRADSKIKNSSLELDGTKSFRAYMYRVSQKKCIFLNANIFVVRSAIKMVSIAF